MQVSVNGVQISEHQINLEAQYHPASHWRAAQHEAIRALIIRQLLLWEAQRRGIVDGQVMDERVDSDERLASDVVRRLTESCVPVPLVSDEDCREYYLKHPTRFMGPELFEASHILLASAVDPAVGDAEQEEARAAVRSKALDVLRQVQAAPHRFEQLARVHSACPSAASGGRLGQISVGETLPEFEQALRRLSPGEIDPSLVETPHGFHIVRLDNRAERSLLPFLGVQDKIRIYLRDARWRQSLQAFITELAEQANIEGFDLASKPPAAPVPELSAERASVSTAAESPAPQPRRLPVLH